MTAFDQFNFSEDLQKAIKKLGFESPTQIQEKAIPLILEGKDVLGESFTGSGKTLAFGCGVIEKVVPQKGLQALILTPTRELAEQVKDVLVQLLCHKRLSILAIYGGVSMMQQIRDLPKSEIVVATPGRFKDHLNRGTVNTKHVSILVLDEADRMLDMGFIDDMEFIIKACPRNRQTLFFSATLSPRIQTLAQKYMQAPIKVLTKKQVDPTKLKQVYYDVARNMKLSLLIHLLKHETGKLVMVFCNSRIATNLVVRNLQANKIFALAIHGGFNQNQRNKAIEKFKSGEVGVLVCTDVAARGLHIDNISHIYNYDLPHDPTDYTNRIGRTARAGEEGIVINLLADKDHDNFSRLLKETRSIYKIEKLPLPEVEKVFFRQDSSPHRGGSQHRGSSGPKKHFGNRKNYHSD